VKIVRNGMARVVPVPLLSLFTSYELEAMVCGSPEIPINMLLSIVTYKGKLIKKKLLNAFIFD
jgi:E3 ubiquitin-protein ligase HERC2